MKSIKVIILGLMIAGFTSSCSTTLPLQATNNSIASKTGVSSNTCLLSTRYYNPASGGTMPSSLRMISNGLCFNGNYGIREAAEDAGISQVATVDLKVTNYVLWLKWELVVTGE
ncbi:MAG: TRL domain-containing protein [Bacteroidia bacterium]